MAGSHPGEETVQFGTTTLSMTWITPLLVTMSVFTTLAWLIITLPYLTLTLSGLNPKDAQMVGKPIKTKGEYKAALSEIEGLMTEKRNTPGGNRLDSLAKLVEAYEKNELRSVATKAELARLKAAARSAAASPACSS